MFLLMYKIKYFLKSLFDDDVWSETGKAIAFSLPTATALTIIYQLSPPIFQYLSGTPTAESLVDVFAHSFAAAGLTGFISQLIQKYKGGSPIGKYSKLIGAGISAALLIPGWESVEQTLKLISREDYLKDIVSDFSGIFSYIGFEGLRNKLKNKLY